MNTLNPNTLLAIALLPLVAAMVSGLLCRVIPRWAAHSVTILGVAASFVLYAIAFSVDAARRALPIRPSRLLGVGLLVALSSSVPAALIGRPFMTAIWTEIAAGSTSLAVGTPLIFDVGVFLTVIGVVLTIVFTLTEGLTEG